MAFWDLKVRRTRPAPVIATGTCRCGAAEIDITPPLHLAMAGHSLLGRQGHGFRGRLFARTLYIEDFDGSVAAICVADMHSGTRYLLEKAASIAGPVSGISVDRLILAGTHTHLAPGNAYGSSLYDALAQSESGFSKNYADWLADRIAASVVEAQRFAVEARLGVHRLPVWDVARNRSIGAFLKNPEAERWHDDGWPGEGRLNPSDLTPNERERISIDPRLTAIAAVSATTDRPLAVFGVFACHATALGDQVEAYATDWNGWAVREAARRLHASYGAAPILGLAQGPCGDVDPDVDWTRGPTFDEARAIGQRVGAGWALAAEEAVNAAAEFEIEVAFDDAEIDPEASETASPDPGWEIGVPAIAGGGVNQVGWMKLLAREGQRQESGRSTIPRQHPKIPAVGQLQDAIRRGANLQASPVLPVHLLKIRGGARDHWLATVCGEPTVMAAHRIERALGGEPPTRDVTVLGLVGDYSGYFTTAEEYDEQHYEGAQTIHGRDSGRYIRERLLALSTSGVQQTDLGADIGFPAPDPSRVFSLKNGGASVEATTPVARRHPADPRHVVLTWRMRGRVQPAFHEGPFVTVFKNTDGRWDLLEHLGRPFDDRYQEVWVSRTRPGFFDWIRRPEWRVELWLPATMPPDEAVQIKVHARGGFAGFEVEL